MKRYETNGVVLFSTINIYMSSADYDRWIQKEAGKVDNLIAFAIQFLTECEARKTWTRKWPLSMTCGYTAPGIGLLLQLFLHNGVSSPETLLASLKQPLHLTMEQFMFAVNETIGNLISTYMINDIKNVFYCGYIIDHPLEKKIVLKIKLNQNNNIENIINILKYNIDIIINLLNDIQNEIEK
jgi:DNA-directed RNA polymerase subunit L